MTDAITTALRNLTETQTMDLLIGLHVMDGDTMMQALREAKDDAVPAVMLSSLAHRWAQTVEGGVEEYEAAVPTLIEWTLDEMATILREQGFTMDQAIEHVRTLDVGQDFPMDSDERERFVTDFPAAWERTAS